MYKLPLLPDAAWHGTVTLYILKTPDKFPLPSPQESLSRFWKGLVVGRIDTEQLADPPFAEVSIGFLPSFEMKMPIS
jgi:hypothetical protein